MSVIRTSLGFCRSRAGAAIILAGSSALFAPVSDAAAQTLIPTMSILHNFATEGTLDFATEGISDPRGALVEATDLNFYGTTADGGTHQSGTVFRMGPDGFTILHSFAGGSDGARPAAGLIQGRNGQLYGTTFAGGTANLGTVFTMTLDGTLTVLHSFLGAIEGGRPEAALLEGRDRNFYGTTSMGGSGGASGTIFRMTPDGTLTVLHSFQGPDGASPNGRLIQAIDGNFYGTTQSGGNGGFGTVFRMTPDGTVSRFYAFVSTAAGAFPQGGVTQAIDGNFYGTVDKGGLHGKGGVYRLDADGHFTFMYSFVDGQSVGGLIATSDLHLWGTISGQACQDFASCYPFQHFPGYLFKMDLAGHGADTRELGLTLQESRTNSLVQGHDGSIYGTATGWRTIDGYIEFAQVFSLSNFAPCSDTLTVRFESGSMNLGFALATTEPATFSTWLAVPGPPVQAFQLWSIAIPSIFPAQYSSVTYPNFPNLGHVMFLSAVKSATGRVCADWKVVDTAP
jgi:uncharacterized repeat protein (TIGR03803 family)